MASLKDFGALSFDLKIRKPRYSSFTRFNYHFHVRDSKFRCMITSLGNEEIKVMGEN